MAVASFLDDCHDDTNYQERSTGLPQDNAQGYREGSPIAYAEQLKGNLLIVHGTGDDNVHFQGTEALGNQLVEHNKQVARMAYPNRSHRIFKGRASRLQLFNLLTRYLRKHGPPGENDLIGQ